MARAIAAGEIRFQNDSEVRCSGNSEKKSFKAGDTYELKNGEVLTVESKGRVPVVIVPADTPRGTIIELLQPEVDQWPSSQIQAVLDKDLSKITERVVTVQDLLAQKKSDEALREIDRLKAEYPGVTYFDFLRASALLLRGNRDEAIEALKRALTAHPDNGRGQALLKALEGASR